ncbi:MAG: polysaccharide lyase family 7 protein [Campylobacterota bacterium]|nr:polysaccharide lyase family 7 protein [Campylobacterota bacterium]
MKLLVTGLIAIFFFNGCDFHQPPEEIDLDLVYDDIPMYDESNSSIPYEHEKFSDVIERSKLQLYTDGTTVDYGSLNNFKSPEFYVDNEENLHFVISKELDTLKVRSELREGPEVIEWSSADSQGHFWVATLKCLKPDIGVDSFTWMQIHGTHETYNYPVLRLFWERSRAGKYDHLWAITIVSDPHTNNIYEYTDLGPRPADFFSAEVHIQNNIMDILINRKLIKTYNLTYWEEVKNYFKAGVYINRFGDGGEVSAIFQSLDFFDDPSKIVSAHH